MKIAVFVTVGISGACLAGFLLVEDQKRFAAKMNDRRIEYERINRCSAPDVGILAPECRDFLEKFQTELRIQAMNERERDAESRLAEFSAKNLPRNELTAALDPCSAAKQNAADVYREFDEWGTRNAQAFAMGVPRSALEPAPKVFEALIQVRDVCG